MKISAKGRYALASLLFMAGKFSPEEYITIPTISKALSISKIYLEQTFSLLKKAELVISVKGAQGGYQLALPPEKITCLDVLIATEITLFDQTDAATGGEDPIMDSTLEEVVFAPINTSIQETLSKISLNDLIIKIRQARENENLMFYI